MKEELTTEKIVENCKTARGEEYDYSKVKKWKNGEETKIELICPHGSYWANYFDFVRGRANCPKCSREKRKKQEEEKFKSEMVSKYGDSIVFPKDFNYLNSYTKVKILYKGEEFFRDPHTFLRTPLLTKEGLKEKVRQRGLNKTLNRWRNILEELNEIHNNKYEYNPEEIRLIQEGKFTRYDLMHLKCPKHGEFVQTFFDHRCGSGCRKCGIENRPIINVSKGENELKNFVKQLYSGEVIENDRKILNGKELDIYLPELKLAFEYDGIFWHNNVNNSFKFEECRKQGIRLIQITEAEWFGDNEKIKNFLNFLFGKIDKKIFARKCEIREIDNKTYEEFCEKNHLQNSSYASVKIGLFQNSELVQLESFGKPRFSKKAEWKLIRECSKSGYLIVGGKQKLLKYFERKYKPKSLLSHCEKNKFSGNSYYRMGFKLDKESQPCYTYFKSHSYIPLSRLAFQKHKLKDLLESFDENLTEWENMANNGYLRLFDYGNYVFKKDYKYD